MICGDRILKSGCLRVREQIDGKRAQRNLRGDENILIVIGTVISPSIPLSGYTIFLDHLRNMYFIVHKLYLTKESLFSVYMINACSNIHS